MQDLHLAADDFKEGSFRDLRGSWKMLPVVVELSQWCRRDKQVVTAYPPMSEEQLKAFLEKVKADTTLQEQLNAATNADDVVEIAKAFGFVISADDATKAQSEVSDAELEAMAGGTQIILPATHWCQRS